MTVQDGYRQDSEKYSDQVEPAKEYIKKIKGEVWRFQVHPSGKVQLQKLSSHGANSKTTRYWSRHMSATVEQCLDYIEKFYRMNERGETLGNLDELEDAEPEIGKKYNIS